MELNKATIKREDTSAHLLLLVGERELKITLTDDNPNTVKGVFNDLLKELKKGPIQFELEDEASDLYHHICAEYITQLNAELTTVYGELEEFQLIEQPAS